jgi:hypothetical protein
MQTARTQLLYGNTVNGWRKGKTEMVLMFYQVSMWERHDSSFGKGDELYISDMSLTMETGCGGGCLRRGTVVWLNASHSWVAYVMTNQTERSLPQQAVVEGIGKPTCIMQKAEYRGWERRRGLSTDSYLQAGMWLIYAQCEVPSQFWSCCDGVVLRWSRMFFTW